MCQIELINSGRICPYCFQEPVYVNSNVVFNKSYGMIYYCKPCVAWVGVHKGTKKAFGRLANAELRTMKGITHMVFDKLWKRGYFTRSGAYKWLAGQLNIDINNCHIGMFDVGLCNKTIQIVNKYLD